MRISFFVTNRESLTLEDIQGEYPWAECFSEVEGGYRVYESEQDKRLWEDHL